MFPVTQIHEVDWNGALKRAKDARDEWIEAQLRTELEDEANIRRGLAWGLCFGVVFWGVMICTVAAGC